MTGDYSVSFLNQYVRIPENISEKLKSLYPTEYESVRHCIGLIVVNLLRFGEIAYSRDKNFYSENHTRFYWYKSMLDAVDIAAADGYSVRLSRGYNYYQHSLSSTLGAGPRLSEFSLRGELELDLESLPLLSVEKRPVCDNSDMVFVKERIANLNRELLTLDVYQQLLAIYNRLDRIYEEALRLNKDYWNKIVIDTRNIDSKQKCFSHVGLTRVFKDGGVGRWFQKGEMSYQQLPKEERIKLLLNGEKVIEKDYSAMHPHLLYAWEHAQCPDNFYELIAEKCGCSRFIAKSLTLIAVNASSYASLVGAISNNKKEAERAHEKEILYNELKRYNLSPKKVVEAIELAHPVMAKYIYSASANKLMLVESDIMTQVLLELMRLGIPALPIHDSIIVPNKHNKVAEQVMQEKYKEHTVFDALIK